MAKVDVSAPLREAHDALCRGATSSLRDLERASGAEAEAWKIALRMARALVERGAGGPLPQPAELEPFVGAAGRVRLAACHACAHGERMALVRWDAGALRAWRELHRRLADGLPDATRGLRRADAWQDLMAGDVLGLSEVGRALFSEGSQAKDASLVIDATLLRALAALTADDLDAATSLSRRASRMARTEGLRAEQFLASIVLARTRRRAGRPHLATRILSVIAPEAPGVWQGWIRWERFLAGSRPVLEAATAGQTGDYSTLNLEALDAPAWHAARDLLRWLEAAAQGDRPVFVHARDAVAKATAGLADARREQAAASAALDPSVDAGDVPESVAPWALGEVDETPAGLHGIVGRPDGAADSTIACVVCGPGRAPRRLLRVATPLLEGEVLRLERTRLRRGRVDTALAALALAGDEGLLDAELFRKAYEYEYSPGNHAGVLDVLVHRMRGRLEGAATVHREDGLLRLEPHALLVLPDPRCVEHVEERLLRVIARHGAVTTRQAAKELNVSVRTAQLALRRLLSAGDCVLNRDGRRVEYVVEDTTFVDLTKL
ncbi:MAG: hypothetical protein AAGH15_14950 [Myxococcota bacterium]